MKSFIIVCRSEPASSGRYQVFPDVLNYPNWIVSEANSLEEAETIKEMVITEHSVIKEILIPGDYELAFEEVFSSREEAQEMIKSIPKDREPLIVGGTFD